MGIIRVTKYPFLSFADFHSMFGMGTMLRKTGAFFMRRSFSNENKLIDKIIKPFNI